MLVKGALGNWLIIGAPNGLSPVCYQQWGKLMLVSVSKFWVVQVENWSGQVEFYIEHKRDKNFQVSAPEI